MFKPVKCYDSSTEIILDNIMNLPLLLLHRYITILHYIIILYIFYVYHNRTLPGTIRFV